MDSTPITPPSRSNPASAFTLVELLIALAIGAVLLAGIITASFQLTRSGVRVTHYAEMDTQVRRCFEQLALDLRAATSFTSNSASDISIIVAKSDGSTAQYTYAWNDQTGSLYRVPGADRNSRTARLWLVSGVSTLSFSRFDLGGNTASSDSATKRVGITLTLARRISGGATASSAASTVFMLRNKPAS